MACGVILRYLAYRAAGALAPCAGRGGRPRPQPEHGDGAGWAGEQRPEMGRHAQGAQAACCLRLKPEHGDLPYAQRFFWGVWGRSPMIPSSAWQPRRSGAAARRQQEQRRSQHAARRRADTQPTAAQAGVPLVGSNVADCGVARPPGRLSRERTSEQPRASDR